MRDDDSNGSESSDNESEGSQPVELLVTGRERRKTAGNRYDRDQILEEAAEEEEPDEVTLLFAAEEGEEDEEFRSDASDEDEMSSSDDEDQGPNAGGEELEGEKELQRQAKVNRSKKRKAEMALTSTAGLRKRPKFDPTQPKVIAKKPSKKKERETWLPAVDTATARASLRKQTIEHREETLARLKENEIQSKKLKAQKAKRDKEKAKDAPKTLTQADRLAEAQRVERRNAKSLNRWETMEKKRIEEQDAKLAALKNRKLDGPVVTLWSGKAYYRGPRPSQVWKEPAVDSSGEPKKRGRKPKGYHEHMAALRAAGNSVPVSSQNSPRPGSSSGQPIQQIQQSLIETSSQAQVAFVQPQVPGNFFLSGIHEYASMRSEATETTNTNAGTPTTAADEGIVPAEAQRATYQENDSTQAQASKPEPEGKVVEAGTISVNAPLITQLPFNDTWTSQTPNMAGPVFHTPIQPFPSGPVEPIEEGYTTKNLVILNRFDDIREPTRQDYSFFYNTRKSAKPVKHNQELCPVTIKPAHYRDPKTGVGYHDMAAYKVLQELKDHKFPWSSMLGCYVGREGMAVARGVPEGFSGR